MKNVGLLLITIRRKPHRKWTLKFGLHRGSLERFCHSPVDFIGNCDGEVIGRDSGAENSWVGCAYLWSEHIRGLLPTSESEKSNCIEFDSEIHREVILSHAHHLKGLRNFSGVQIRPALAPLQRQLKRRLDDYRWGSFQKDSLGRLPVVSNQRKVKIVPRSVGPWCLSPRCLLPLLVNSSVSRLPVLFMKASGFQLGISQWISRPGGCSLPWMGTNKGVEARENRGKLVTAVCRVVVFQEKTYKKYGSVSRQLGNTMASWNMVHGNWHGEFYSRISWIHWEWPLVNFSPGPGFDYLMFLSGFLLVLLFGWQVWKVADHSWLATVW